MLRIESAGRPEISKLSTVVQVLGRHLTCEGKTVNGKSVQGLLSDACVFDELIEDHHVAHYSLEEVRDNPRMADALAEHIRTKVTLFSSVAEVVGNHLADKPVTEEAVKSALDDSSVLNELAVDRRIGEPAVSKFRLGNSVKALAGYLLAGQHEKAGIPALAFA